VNTHRRPATVRQQAPGASRVLDAHQHRRQRRGYAASLAMIASHSFACIDAAATLSPEDAASLLDAARLVRRCTLEGTAAQLLQGKKLGLVCASAPADDEAAALFCSAALALGAHVAHIRPPVWPAHGWPRWQACARLFGRLYDAVECQGLPRAAIGQLRQHSDVPIYEGLAGAGHPTVTVATLLDAALPADERRRLVLQAALWRSLT
jgi:ornithine carbamoyltransferase